jgi:hypothetical protein
MGDIAGDVFPVQTDQRINPGGIKLGSGSRFISFAAGKSCQQQGRQQTQSYDAGRIVLNFDNGWIEFCFHAAVITQAAGKV